MTRKILEDSLVRTPEDYDSQVIELVQALELAELGSRIWREWFSAYFVSRYTFIPFCERYKEHLREKRSEEIRLCDAYYQMNKKHSRYVHKSYRDKPDLAYRSDEGLFGPVW